MSTNQSPRTTTTETGCAPREQGERSHLPNEGQGRWEQARSKADLVHRPEQKDREDGREGRTAMQASPERKATLSWELE